MTDYLHAIVDDVLEEAADDWVPLASLIWSAERHVTASEEDAHEAAMAALYLLLSQRLAQVGDLGESGFEPWSGADVDLVARVRAQCDELDWNPMGDGCWFAAIDSSGEPDSASDSKSP